MLRPSLPLLLLFFLRPALAGKANSFEIVGTSGVSAQQMFLSSTSKVMILDKTENNIAQVMGVGGVSHPAWATEYDLATNTYIPLDVTTNSFCAGGNVLGNGSWLNVGGNSAVTTGGIADKDVPGGAIIPATSNSGAYDDLDGARATRMLNCQGDKCAWFEEVDGIPVNRWYPTLETIEDGSIMIIGGEMYGGFVNSENQHQNVPTYEFWPNKGPSVTSPFLSNTQPANLYPLTWLLPNGLIFMQANWQTTLLNYTSNVETPLPNITKAQKTYPASGSTVMLPLTAENNWTPTVLFCGGMDPVRDDWDNTQWVIVETPTSNSCVSIKPMDPSPSWVDDDNLPENRGLGNFIILPDQRLFLANGVGKGSAGYGWNSWAVGQSYATDPVLRPAYYNGSAPAGHRFDTNLPNSTINRMYHSSATLLPDGSVMISGSNPNADVITEQNNATYPYKTEYRVEIFYPSYYDAPRPTPSGIPTSIGYGGKYFDITVPASCLNGTDLGGVKVALIRTGFSTHAMNMGQRYVQLQNTYTGNSDGSATIHVSQLQPNPALLVPGPALFFVIVNGVPSIGQFVMVGSGQLGTQPTSLAAVLPSSSNNFGTAVTTGTAVGSAPLNSSPNTATTATLPSSSKLWVAAPIVAVAALALALAALLWRRRCTAARKVQEHHQGATESLLPLPVMAAQTWAPPPSYRDGRPDSYAPSVDHSVKQTVR